MTPIWSSAFRPFFVAAPAYAVLVMGLWALAEVPAAWHAHEMLFGFVAATSAGFLLTAIPSWAGTPAVEGRPLAGLLALWGAGRLAMLASPWLPPGAVAAVDAAFFPVLALVMAPGAVAAPHWVYRLAPLVVLGFAAGNLTFHAGRLAGAPHAEAIGLGVGLYSLTILFSFVGGFLTPIFTRTVLYDRGWPGRIDFDRRIEIAAPATLAVVGACDLGGLPLPVTAAAAAVAAACHAWRQSRWQALRVADEPLLLAMNAGYAGLVLALALLALAAVLDWSWRTAAIHLFTVGGLGLMKLSLLTRVVLKHTGRPVRASAPILAGFAAIGAAAAIRVGVGLHLAGEALLPAAALLWAAAFAIYLWLYAGMLTGPSLPRTKKP